MMSRLLVFAYGVIIQTGTGRLPARLRTAAIGALVLTAVWPAGLVAQNHTDHRSQPNDLVRVVRDATERFKDVAAAENEEYHLLFGCVTDDDSGAMGLHFVNMDLVMDGVLDATRPEIILYEPLPNGTLRITGADYLVFADAWDAANPGTTPQLMGQLFHRFESPNRFGLPAFYTLHVWAWKPSPTGTFVNWHEKVSCDGFNGQ